MDIPTGTTVAADRTSAALNLEEPLSRSIRGLWLFEP
jgi:hypothetical protein